MAKKRKAPAKKKAVKKKPARKKTSKTEEPVYIGIPNPDELRRHLLEPNREVIQFLQNYEQFHATKQEKTKTILQLKEDIKQIRLEVNRLRRYLPKSKLKLEKPARKMVSKPKALPKEIEEPYPEPEPKPVPKPRKMPSELEALEKELSEIESKLGTLS